MEILLTRLKLLLNRDIFRAVSVYTASGILTKAIPFLLLPVFTHYLSTSDYGIISLVSSSILALIPFINLGINDLITIEFKKREKENYLFFQGTALTVSLLFCLFAMLLAVLFTKYFSQFTTLPLLCIFLIPVLTYLNFCNDFLLIIVRNDDKKFLFLLISVLKTTIELSLAIVLIVWFKMQWLGRIDGMLLTGILFAFYLLFYLSKKGSIKLNLNRENVRSIVKFGLPTIPLYFMIFSLYNADKFMLSKVLGSKEQVGLYTIAFQIAYIINMLITAFYTALLPKLYDWIRENTSQSKARFVKSLYLSTAILLLAGAALYFLAPLIYHIFIDKKYWGSMHLLPYFIICFIIWNVFAMLLPVIFYFKKTSYLYYINIAAIIINLGSLYFFIKTYGVIGACYANLLSFFALILLMIFFANKTYPLPWMYFLSLSKKNL